jgi:hypothetical protein
MKLFLSIIGFIWLLIFGVFLFAGCASRQPLKPNYSHNHTYVYYHDEDGKLIVLTKSRHLVDQAVEELNCKPCIVSEVGTLYSLEDLSQ